MLAYLGLAARIPIQTEPEAVALADGLDALRRLAAGQVAGAAVLLPGKQRGEAGEIG